MSRKNFLLLFAILAGFVLMSYFQENRWFKETFFWAGMLLIFLDSLSSIQYIIKYLFNNTTHKAIVVGYVNTDKNNDANDLTIKTGQIEIKWGEVSTVIDATGFNTINNGDMVDIWLNESKPGKSKIKSRSILNYHLYRTAISVTLLTTFICLRFWL